MKKLFTLVFTFMVSAVVYGQNSQATQSLNAELERFANSLQPESGIYPPLNQQILIKCIKEGANVNTTNSDGETVAHLIIAKGWENVMQLLVDRKANFNIKAKTGEMTPLHTAAIYGNAKLIAMMLQNGANPNVSDDDKETPLHFAVDRESLPSVKLLVEAGADLNAGNSIDSTPLHIAVEKNKLEIAAYLLQKGAKVDIKGSICDCTPLRKASIKGFKEMQALLKQYGAKKR